MQDISLVWHPLINLKDGKCRRDMWARFGRFFEGTRNDLAYFVEFLGPHWPFMQQDVTRISRWIVIPCLGIAALLFYVLRIRRVNPNKITMAEVATLLSMYWESMVRPPLRQCLGGSYFLGFGNVSRSN